MSGLICKDIELLKCRWNALAVILAIGVMMGFTTEGSFVVGYITLLSSILGISTVSYDEYDNGLPFLMTLPITRKLYVQSKYLFSSLVCAAGWLISLAVYAFVCMTTRGGFTLEQLMETPVFIPIFLLVLALMLPLQLKFGAEGSRFVMAIIAGLVAVTVFFGKKLNPGGLSMPAFLENASFGMILGILMIVGIIAVLVSYLISVSIMNHKTY